MILDWKEFMPSNVWYDIDAGRVSIVFRTDEEKETYQGRTMKAIATNERLARKHNRLPGQDGNCYVLSRRQKRAVVQHRSVPTTEQDQAV